MKSYENITVYGSSIYPHCYKLATTGNCNSLLFLFQLKTSLTRRSLHSNLKINVVINNNEIEVGTQKRANSGAESEKMRGKCEKGKNII